jgi:hypothetical protein
MKLKARSEDSRQNISNLAFDAKLRFTILVSAEMAGRSEASRLKIFNFAL